MRDLPDGVASVDCFGCDDAVITTGKFARIAGCMQPGREVGGAGKAKSIAIDRGRVVRPEVVGPDLGLARFREVSSEEAANSTASDDANLHTKLCPLSLEGPGTPILRRPQYRHIETAASRVSDPL